MKNIVLSLALGALALGSMVGAHADQQVQKPWTVQIGASWPSSGDAKQIEGSTVFNAGVDYAFNKTKAEAPIVESVYFDYVGGTHSGVIFKAQGNTNSDSGKLNSYGIGLAARESFAGSAGMTPYAGLGLGVYQTTSDYDVPGSAGVTFSDKTATGIGGKIFAGLQFSGDYFVQIAYNWLPKDDLKANTSSGSATDSLDPSNFALDLGIRF